MRRQPFGGWKRSSVGAGTKAGGPNYLLGLGSWEPEQGSSSRSLHLRGLEDRVSDLIESGQSSMDYTAFDLVRRSALSDAIAAANEYHAVKDVSRLGVERNLFRYRPVPVTIRLSEGAELPELLRVMAAGTVARSPFTVSTLHRSSARDAPPAPERGRSTSRSRRMRSGSPGSGAAESTAHRIRLIGGDPAALAAALGGTPDVAVYSNPVTASGRVELLPFLHEQAISITNHRFGNPTTLTDGILPAGA